MADPESIDRLCKAVEACGQPDSFIDQEEEASLFALGEEIGLPADEVETQLNQLCQQNNWSRETEIANDLLALLEEATSDDGVVDQQEFLQGIEYAVSLHMPRKRAMELGVRFVVEKQLKIKRNWFGLGSNWFDQLKEQYLP